MLIAAGAITTSFFGGQALGHAHIGIAAGIAIACFCGLGFVVLAILWPRRDWELSLAPGQIISTYLEPEEDEPLALHLIQRDLVLHLDESAASNRRRLHVLTLVLRAGALLLVTEVLAWIVALIWHQ